MIFRPVTARLIDDADALETYHEQWDELAVAAARPYCAPGWMLPWWRCAAPPGAELRVALALDGDRLLGVAPFFVESPRALVRRYRLLSSETSFRLEPLARQGHERACAHAFARALATAPGSPHLLLFEGVEADSPWPGRLAEAWPGRRAWIHRGQTRAAPTLDLGMEDIGEWLATRRAGFRRELRRRRRKLVDLGARFRLATPETLEGDLEAFAALHYARWSDRGGSQALDPRVERMLREAAGRLDLERRFMLWSLELEGEVIASTVCLAAGGEVSTWLTGFDESHRTLAPSIQLGFKLVEDGLERGETRIDFHLGHQEYKRRFADGEDLLQPITLVPPGPRHPFLRARLARPRRPAPRRR